MIFTRSVLLALLAVSNAHASGSPTVLVTGATGKTGFLIYSMLKDKGVNVRGFVRNVTKARDMLKCQKCDASEGIYVGDISIPADLVEPMKGVTALAIATSAIPHCKDFRNPATCGYPKNAYPRDIDWLGMKKQIAALAHSNKKASVVMISSMGTTEPNSWLDKLGNGQIGFYKLNAEASLMDSGLPFTIIKPCGLNDDEAGHRELVAGHDDEMHETPPMIPRADVARVALEALLRPGQAAGLRFDLCSKVGTPTTDVSQVLRAARYPWQSAQLDQISV